MREIPYAGQAGQLDTTAGCLLGLADQEKNLTLLLRVRYSMLRLLQPGGIYR